MNDNHTMKISTATLFNVPISITRKEQVLAVIAQWVREKKTKVIATPNPEIIVAAQKDPELMAALQHADLSIADGWGVALALRALNSKLETLNSKLQRISGIELMEALIEKAAKEGWKVMLVGGKPGVAQQAAEKLISGFASSQVARIASLSGPSDIFHCSSEEMNNVIIDINRFKPDLLFVAFGPGRQEKWLTAYRSQLTAGVAMGVGGALDQIADPTLRPPYSIDRIGLGWLYRLMRQPWRWRRQIALITFIKMILKEKLKVNRLAG